MECLINLLLRIRNNTSIFFLMIQLTVYDSLNTQFKILKYLIFEVHKNKQKLFTFYYYYLCLFVIFCGVLNTPEKSLYQLV